VGCRKMDMNLFDLTAVELVKKKYYNAAKISELMDNVRDEYLKLSRENEELKAQLDSLSAQKSQISDTLMSAQSIARQLIDDAKTQAEETARLAQTQAEETVKAAEKKAELILAGARTKKEAADADVSEVQEYALRCVENCVDKLRAQHMEAIEYLNAQWQDFLSGLILPEMSSPSLHLSRRRCPKSRWTGWPLPIWSCRSWMTPMPTLMPTPFFPPASTASRPGPVYLNSSRA